MNVQEIINKYQHAVIQIATQTGTGTGFYLKDYDLIITNNHVINNTPEVTIQGKTFERQLAKVWYTDQKHDLAFVQAPAAADLADVHIGTYEALNDGDNVIAIGHPYNLSYSATQGVISKVDRIREGLKYIQIDAAINPGNSGGPLVDYAGFVIGVNSFIIKGGDNLGFALPSTYLKEAIDLYLPYRGQEATRCSSCDSLVTAANIDNNKYCPNCGAEVKLLQVPEKEVELMGVAKLIEDILKDLGKDVRLARDGVNQWSVKEGSAKINISYNPDNYFIAGDAFLCQMPPEPAKIKPLYQFLLAENNKPSGLVLSCQKNNIVLSRLLYDLDMTRESGLEEFKTLFQQADHYDDYLKNEFGCTSRLEE
ncbi:trypsin-like peptidase domain-containing protein [Niabella soli]|uniref:Peptidase S1 n=1 Tax=Niabella soli DSM 19437 TaxID=929713 RepID=W0F4M8_9BACT|nr:trypsin-like peptidase domain-containing protein [Niabella soli]AHF16276.1 peptidase S1 [Niabella soli DSM 19437]